MGKTNSKSVYLVGIAGIAMGTLAAMLKERGYEVTGSDQNLYPPMSTHLEELGIVVHQGFDPLNIIRSAPDQVVIGNVVRRENPEAQHVIQNHLPYLSMPQALEEYFLDDHLSIVAAGTHGKSTTSALLGWVLDSAGTDPSAFIGAFVKNWDSSYRLGKGKYMVLEGDEYDTAYFDKGPKFLHYRPHIGIVTSIEYDHADIFPSFEAVRDAFRKFACIIPENGHIILNADDPECRLVKRECKGAALTYGRSNDADWRLIGIRYEPGKLIISFMNPLNGKVESLISGIPGEHNAMNTLAVTAAASIAGLTMDSIQKGILSFKGVKRRQDILGEAGGILVMEDFAHHPTAVRETIRAIRLFYPDRRLVAVFEPRTNSSRRNIFQEAYSSSFDEADLVCIKEPPGLESIPAEERLDAKAMVTAIGRRGKDARFFRDSDSLLSFLLAETYPGDLALCMSNGSFDGIPSRLLTGLSLPSRTGAGTETL